MISHRNIIANMMMIRWHESVGREIKGVTTQTLLGLLPLSREFVSTSLHAPTADVLGQKKQGLLTG
jgi:hypothetical protein